LAEVPTGGHARGASLSNGLKPVEVLGNPEQNFGKLKGGSDRRTGLDLVDSRTQDMAVDTQQSTHANTEHDKHYSPGQGWDWAEKDDDEPASTERGRAGERLPPEVFDARKTYQESIRRTESPVQKEETDTSIQDGKRGEGRKHDGTKKLSFWRRIFSCFSDNGERAHLKKD